MLLCWAEGKLWLYLCHQGSSLLWIGERGRQLKCPMALFKAAFILKEEKSENNKTHRKDSKKIGNPYLRMNCEFWRVLWSLFIICERETPFIFLLGSLSCRDTIIKWRLPGVRRKTSSPEVCPRQPITTQPALSPHTPPTLVDPVMECDWCIVGLLWEGFLVTLPGFPAVPYLVAFDRTSLSCS